MQDKIIKLFYDDIYSEFTINELAAKTKISYSIAVGIMQCFMRQQLRWLQ